MSILHEMRCALQKITRTGAFRKKHIKVGHGNFFSKKTCLFGYNIIGVGNFLDGTSIGEGTNIANFNNLSNIKIGKFCSIGNNVSVVDSQHPSKTFVSTHPAFYQSGKKLFFPKGSAIFLEHLRTDDGHSVNVGNDVWIGNNVLLKGSISIGDGAIIGMGSVVTKDVAPYAVVGGNPAKLIRYRFTPEQISKLQSIDWFNWDLKTIFVRKEDFADIDQFLEKYSSDHL